MDVITMDEEIYELSETELIIDKKDIRELATTCFIFVGGAC
jgi:hypothetical protein